MTETHTSYSLRRFRSSSEPGFAEVLRIYSTYTPASLKTNTNEITYWIDSQQASSSPQVLIFGFYGNEQPIGYAQLAYFPDERLLVVDYLVVAEAHRKNNIFFEFVEHLRSAVLSEGREVDYAVAEVGFLSHSPVPSRYSRVLIRLLKFAGFSVIKAPYYQPMLGSANYESKMRATLMVFAEPHADSIAQQTYVRFVETIYYQHYLKWYSIYEEEVDTYRAELDTLMTLIRDEIGGRDFIHLNGYRDSYDTGDPGVTLPDNKMLRFAQISLIFVLVLTLTIAAAAVFFKMSTVTLVGVFFLCLISYFAVLSVASREASRTMSRLMNFVLAFFRRRI